MSAFLGKLSRFAQPAWLLAVGCWLLFGWQISSSPVIAASPGIVGKDDRQLFDHGKLSQFNAIGRLNREGAGFCSAVLIAPTEILTAAHCIWDRSKRRFMLPQTLHFVPGYRRGSYLGHARGSSYQTAPGLVFDDDGKPSVLADDWAVVELDLNLTTGAGIKPIPLAGVATILALTPNSRLLRVGYGYDRPHLPVKVDPCSVSAIVDKRRLLVHDCDATSGDSGSPIMIGEDGALKVIGVHSSLAKSGGTVHGLAVVVARHLPADVMLNPVAGEAAAKE